MERAEQTARGWLESLDSAEFPRMSCAIMDIRRDG